MAGTVWFVGPWDLDARLACVPRRPEDGPVLLVASEAKGAALPWHRQKLVLVLSAIAHFARDLEARGFDVTVRRAPTYVDGIRAEVAARGARRVVALAPREYGLHRALVTADLGAALELHDDGGPGGHFLLPRDAFAAWAASRPGALRMDTFYRWMRRRTGLLMDGDRPVGGRWSFDVENRQPVPDDVPAPEVPAHAPDALTASVQAQVAAWPGLWGDAEGFAWPVDRAGALAELDAFVAHRLPSFGVYQDAMRVGAPFLWHARLSVALNLSLLHPQEVVDAAVAAYEAGHAPLPAVEGFVRQVIGWREFIRGVYWLRMPGLRDANLLDATRPLPDFFWDPSRTRMACVADAVGNVKRHGYAHHIQRLMVLGNLALLAGVRPLDVSHWFWAGFVDAYEWVELPNVHGMALYADDSFTTKPYAASGAYVNRMGDACGRCAYDVKRRHGEGACPFNPLFWDFLARHEARFARNPRLSRLVGTWRRFPDAERDAIRASAAAFLDALRPSPHTWTFDDDGC